MEFKKKTYSKIHTKSLMPFTCTAAHRQRGWAGEIVKINIQTSRFQNNHCCTSLTKFITIPLLVFLQKSFNLYFTYIVVRPACVSMHPMYVWHARKPKGSVRSSLVVGSHKMDARNQAQILWKDQCSSLLSHLHKPLPLYLCISMCAWVYSDSVRYIMLTLLSYVVIGGDNGPSQS